MILEQWYYSYSEKHTQTDRILFLWWMWSSRKKKFILKLKKHYIFNNLLSTVVRGRPWNSPSGSNSLAKPHKPFSQSVSIRCLKALGPLRIKCKYKFRLWFVSLVCGFWNQTWWYRVLFLMDLGKQTKVECNTTTSKSIYVSSLSSFTGSK